LTVAFGDTYPLLPPKVTIQNAVRHPNVFGDYSEFNRHTCRQTNHKLTS
jgi:ubiquitin-protein ligase